MRPGERPGACAESASWTLPPEPGAATHARQQLAAWVRERGYDSDDVALVASELLSNAVEVARAELRLDVSVDGAHLTMVVTDDGHGGDLDGAGLELPAEGAEGGRGLVIVRALAERVDVTSTPEGTTFRCVLPVAPPAATVPAQPSPVELADRSCT